ncbi:MAG: hypothetical protein AAF439_11875 [Pseudomonadota bacterium]
MRTVAKLLGLTLLMGLLPAQAASAEDYVVLGATGLADRYSAGDRLAAGGAHPLKDGEVLTLIARDGTLIQLVGPCDCGLPAPDEDQMTMEEDGAEAAPALPRPTGSPPIYEGAGWEDTAARLAALVVPRPGAPATREALPGAAGETGLWVMAADSSGARCVKSSDIKLWRRRTAEAVTVDLRSKVERLTGLTWSAGEHLLTVPEKLVVDGEALVLTVDAEPRRFTVHVLPDGIGETDWGQILIWMAAMSCRRQAQYLIDGLHDGSLFPDSARVPGQSEM